MELSTRVHGMSIENPTPIELEIRAQSMERVGGRLQQQILSNGSLRVQLEALAKDNGELRTLLRFTRRLLLCALAVIFLSWALFLWRLA